MKYGDKVLFMIMDTDRAGCLIIINNLHEQEYYGDLMIRNEMLQISNNLVDEIVDNNICPTVTDTKIDNVNITYGLGTITQLRITKTRDITTHTYYTGKSSTIATPFETFKEVKISAIDDDKLFEVETTKDTIIVFDHRKVLVGLVTTYKFENGLTEEINRQMV